MGYVATTLDVRNIEESLRFYQEVLGFSEWFRWGEGSLVAGGLRRGEGRVILSRADKLSPEQLAQRGIGTGLYVDVGDEEIDALYDRVKGVARVVEPIADRPWGDRTFIIADPDGYTVEVAKTTAEG